MHVGLPPNGGGSVQVLVRTFLNSSSTCYTAFSPARPVHVTTAGLQITAGQRTMSGQNWVLTGQIFGWPDMLSGHLPTR